MRERGLKQLADGQPYNIKNVAPHAGAWVETGSSQPCIEAEQVAPHAGAWVETYVAIVTPLLVARRSPCGSVG